MRAALKRVYFGSSGDAPANAMIGAAPRDEPFLSVLPDPPDGPLSFMSDADLDLYTTTFERVGMVGAFNRYRALTLAVVDVFGRRHALSPSVRYGTLAKHADPVRTEFRACGILYAWLIDPSRPTTNSSSA